MKGVRWDPIESAMPAQDPTIRPADAAARARQPGPTANGIGAPAGDNLHPAAADRPATVQEPRPDAEAGRRLFSRDLSWLEFNRRVLELALDDRTPLLERVKFLGIFGSNLDEFAMKRLGWLRRRVGAGLSGPDQDGLTAGVLLAAMRRTIRELQHQQAVCYETAVRPALAREGIELLEYESVGAAERRWLDDSFRKTVFPVLTPLAVDPGHRFPFISNLSRNFGVLLTEPGRAEPLFARLKIPNGMTQWVRLPAAAGEGEDAGRGRYVELSDIIHNNLDDLFPGMQIVEVVPFRVTRDSEEEATDDDADNLLDLVEAQLKRRRFARAVRLEVGANPSPKILGHLAEELKLTADDIDERTGPLDYTTLAEISDLPRPELRWPRWTPVVPARLARKHTDIFSIIREGDVLVHHPFESFTASAERFIAEASRDPDVLGIKQTIYRTSRDSPFVSSLIRAAEAGKQVACLVELRARFDEQSNVRFARMLEKAGAHVAYGVVGLKTHCKAALVVRRETDGLRCYAHLGTGNYHPKTAQLYTDLGLFTCDPAVTDDVIELFNLLTGRSRQDCFDTLLVAPTSMRARFLALIDREMQFARRRGPGQAPPGADGPGGGRIVAKMNALADQEITEKLYEASQAGVQITLFVRGFCCLRPGVPGLSENIRVISVVGRFLEHSRIFHFGAGYADPVDGDWYISSADWMYRNLNNRVEAACPVKDRAARGRLQRVIDVMLADRRKAWELLPDGRYVARTPPPGAPADSPAVDGTFATLMREAMGG